LTFHGTPVAAHQSGVCFTPPKKDPNPGFAQAGLTVKKHRKGGEFGTPSSNHYVHDNSRYEHTRKEGITTNG
jgi:hypothetical protein